jgi:catechol 2,3-dioxygenase-like lactoylglutathione lyase family enzyme
VDRADVISELAGSPPAARATLRHGVVGVTDIDRSRAFYRDALGVRVVRDERTPAGRRRCLLNCGGRHLMLEELPRPGTSAWVDDDLQLGMRHIGFKVDDTDGWAERVRAAGGVFTREPFDAFGGVRIAFFRDPDGAHLELVQSVVRYTDVWSPSLAAAEASLPVPRRPRFDHVALSVTDVEATLTMYREALGFEVIGRLAQSDAPHGFLITYVAAGEAILELFSYTAPMRPNSWTARGEAPGLLRVGVGTTHPRRTLRAMERAGATAAGRRWPGAHQVAVDGDGTPYEIGRMRAAPTRSG